MATGVAILRIFYDILHVLISFVTTQHPYRKLLVNKA